MTSAESTSPLGGVCLFTFGLIAYAIMLGVSLKFRPGAESPWPIPGYGVFDVVELASSAAVMYTHYALVQAAVDARAGARESAWPAATVFRFSMAEAVYMAGHGMHIVANGLEAARGRAFQISEEEQVSPTSMFLYFSHEVVGHNVQYTGLMLVVAVAVAAEGGVGAAPSFVAGWALPALLSAAWVPLSIGTRTAVTVTPLLLTCLLFDVKTAVGAASGGYVRAFFQRTALFTLAAFAATAYKHGGSIPTMDDLDGVHINVRDRVFASMRAF
eukprot:TRINITY_DN16332_c0_g1_i1.p1 TRINITY_DN16332_c0_g1~~TRINITY_DN16332_c0_g1_i1.p1  ORF type:complete len:301 (+),score=61.11 TRINITY_DN16332_c0_g1_i1:88-903(+)